MAVRTPDTVGGWGEPSPSCTLPPARVTHTEPPHHGTNTLPGGPTWRVQTESESGGSARDSCLCCRLTHPTPTPHQPPLFPPKMWALSRSHLIRLFFLNGQGNEHCPHVKGRNGYWKMPLGPQITQPLLREPTRFNSVAPGRTWRQGQPGGRHLCSRSWGSFPRTLWRFLELRALLPTPTPHPDPPACTAPVAPPLWPRPPPSGSSALSSIQTLRPYVRCYPCPFGPR